MNYQSKFTEIFNREITRNGSKALFDFLLSSDFFTAPASTRFHNAFEGGLVLHSLNVYECLRDILARPRMTEVYKVKYADESIAVTALLHDLCKVNVYTPDFRNTKNDVGIWEKVPCYKYDDKLPYGHGEKSVYMISGFMKLTRDEAMAIRWHMGFSGVEDNNLVGNALSSYPLAYALFAADMEATYFLEKL
jgi:hypothetical protein